MSRRYFPDIDKFQAKTELERQVRDALEQLYHNKRQEIKSLALRNLAAMVPMRIEDPSRLAAVNIDREECNKSWLILHRYTQQANKLVRAWWAYNKGEAHSLDVVHAANVLLYMIANDGKIWDKNFEVPCES